MVNPLGLGNRLARRKPSTQPWVRKTPNGQAGTPDFGDLYNDLVEVLRWASPTYAPRFLRILRAPRLLSVRFC